MFFVDWFMYSIYTRYRNKSEMYMSMGAAAALLSFAINLAVFGLFMFFKFLVGWPSYLELLFRGEFGQFMFAATYLIVAIWLLTKYWTKEKIEELALRFSEDNFSSQRGFETFLKFFGVAWAIFIFSLVVNS